ncbi:MAG TPA: response regulator [Nitrospiria bacterium]
MNALTKITIYSAHHDWRNFDAVRRALQEQPDMRLLGWAEDEKTLLKGIQKHLPGVLLFENGFETRNRLELFQAIRTMSPLTRILVVSGQYSTDEEARAAVEGARGYICEPFTPETLQKAVRATWEGEVWMRRSTVSMVLKDMIRSESPSGKTLPPH